MKLFKNVTIEGHDYQLRHIMPTHALPLIIDVMAVFTPILDELDADVINAFADRIKESDSDQVLTDATEANSDDVGAPIKEEKRIIADATDIEMLKMLSPLINRLQNTDVNNLIHRLCDSVVYNGYKEGTDYDFKDETDKDMRSPKGKLKQNWDTHFMGRPFLPIKIAWEMLSFNYASFLDGNPVTSALLEKTQGMK